MAKETDVNKQEKTKKKRTKLEKWFTFMHRAHHLLRPLFPYKKHGHTQPFNEGTYIIVGNHRSLFDVIPAALTTDRPVHFIAKKELWNKGLMKKFVIKCECIPVSRDGGDVRAIMTERGTRPTKFSFLSKAGRRLFP